MIIYPPACYVNGSEAYWFLEQVRDPSAVRSKYGTEEKVTDFLPIRSVGFLIICWFHIAIFCSCRRSLMFRVVGACRKVDGLVCTVNAEDIEHHDYEPPVSKQLVEFICIIRRDTTMKGGHDEETCTRPCDTASTRRLAVGERRGTFVEDQLWMMQCHGAMEADSV
jgi:hypothetical protein